MKKIFALLPFIFLLTSCVDLHAPTASQTQFQTESPAAHLKALSQLNTWTMDGALSITLKNQQPEIANYTWTQDSNHYHITLSSALSLYRITIDKNAGVITLSKNGVRVTQASTPEKLMQNALGWSLPVDLLRYWIKGMPAPKVPFTATFDSFGHLALLQQAGFTVKYNTYQTTANQIVLPQLISMQSPLLFAKIVIKHFDTRAS